jgi:mannose-1-phosphate guanylyltransferase
MAGGSGTRFWPRSRVRVPKQLLAIVGTRSMLQETVARVSPPIARDRVLVVTGRLHARAVRAQLPRLPAEGVLVEPEGRNTAAAIALAAVHVARRDPDAVMAVLPADHAIGGLATFRADLRLALDLAAGTGALVTLGVPPTYPETGYGYIRCGAPLRGADGRAAEVEAFVEKPDRTRAEALIAEGGTLWNAGIFAWRAASILAELRAHLPAVVAPLEIAVARGGARARRRLPAAPAISIDHGVPSARGAWWWSAALRVERRRELGRGRGALGWARRRRQRRARRALPVDSRGCVVDSPRRLVALLGVEDLVVIDTPDAILVCRKDRAQDVRLVVEELRRRGLEQYL